MTHRNAQLHPNAPTAHLGSDDEELAATFPFESKYVEVLGSKMHYVDEGEGDPIIFLHGNPTSSYLWRNVLPHVTGQSRAIAVDLIGMGKSDKPDIPYRYDDHYRYLSGFIDALDLGDNITLVIHDWGSGLGFRWAHEHKERMKGIAFLDGLVGPLQWRTFPADFKVAITMLRNPVMNWVLGTFLNIFLNVMLQQGTKRKITKAAMKEYRAPYPTHASRRAVARWPREIPIDGFPADNHAHFVAYHEWLKTTELPKLMLYGDEAALLTGEDLAFGLGLKNMTAVPLGEAIHFVQETCPHRVGRELSSWYATL